MDKILGHQEFKDANLWKALVAEFIGTAFLVLIGCGSTTGGNSDRVEIAFAFGLTVGVMVQTIAHISGGHINPAVTAGMLVTGNISIIRAVLYVIFQLLGAIVGAAVLAGVLPSDQSGALGQTIVGRGVTHLQGMCIEILITFVLVFTVFAIVDPNRPEHAGIGPMIIGLSVGTCHLWAIRYTGASMNTARSFGPAVIGNRWDNHWIYWVGPILGGIIAGLLYTFLFSNSPPKRKEPDLERPAQRLSNQDLN